MCFYKCSGLFNFYMWIWMKSRKRGIKKDLVVTKNKDTRMRKQRLEELFDYNVQTENYWHASVGNWQYFRHIFTTRRRDVIKRDMRDWSEYTSTKAFTCWIYPEQRGSNLLLVKCNVCCQIHFVMNERCPTKREKFL